MFWNQALFILNVDNPKVHYECFVIFGRSPWWTAQIFVESQARLLNAYKKPRNKSLILFRRELNGLLSLCNANESIPDPC